MPAVDKKASELTAPVSINDTDVFPGYRPGTGGEPNLDIRATAALLRSVTANGRTAADKFDEVVDLRDFDGVDPTGANSSASALASALSQAGTAGKHLVIPPGTFTIDVTPRATVAGTVIRGMGGVLRQGAANTSCLEIAASDCTAEDLILENPFGYSDTTGWRTSGIAVSNSQRTHVRRCRLDGFMNAIIVTTTGTLGTGAECYDVYIVENRITNCIGVSSQSRGGGIMSFGSRVAVVGNFVHGNPNANSSPSNGVGLLHGIKSEGLAAFRVDGGFDDHVALFAFNTVLGPFLHGMFIEQTDYSQLIGNYVRGSMANAMKIGAKRCSAVSNILGHVNNNNSWSAFAPATFYMAEGSNGSVADGLTVFAEPWTNTDVNDAAIVISDYAADVKIKNWRVSKGMTYLNEYTLSGITGTFQSGTGGTSTVTDGTYSARIADWTNGTSIMRTAQANGWFDVGATLTQAAGSASGTVAAVAPAPQIIKAGVRGSSSMIYDLLLEDGVIERATCNTGVVLPATTRLKAKGITVRESLDGRGFQLNTSSVDAMLEGIRVMKTGAATVSVGESQGIYVANGVGAKLRDCTVDATGNTSGGIHLESCTNPDVDGPRVKSSSAVGLKFLTCTGVMVDMARIDAATTYGLDFDNSTVARIGLVKAAGTTQNIIYRNGASGDGSAKGDLGNADNTFTEDQANGFTYCNTALTADRALNLPATGRPGATLLVARRSSATGAFNLNVKNSAGTTLKALSAASTNATFAWNASGAGGWLFVGSGTI